MLNYSLVNGADRSQICGVLFLARSLMLFVENLGGCCAVFA